MNGQLVTKLNITNDKINTLKLNVENYNQRVINIDFVIENPVSPMQLNQGSDPRHLGIAVISAVFK